MSGKTQGCGAEGIAAILERRQDNTSRKHHGMQGHMKKKRKKKKKKKTQPCYIWRSINT